MTKKSPYRGTYVMERQEDDGSYTVLLSVSSEHYASSAEAAYDPLIMSVSERITESRSLIGMAEEPTEDGPSNDEVPNSPTIRAVTDQEGK